ncbi:hypothetical protein [Aquimarina sp. 2201CG5-10]|uniref:hypothetical protein n=1 Tax=Aquimarina callyspongiae TaxID=3098150 RepID=UPI002AB4CCD9|nr:hypothetical protein [Aquimarina sp. 2201CG5-10]MDY8134570.1 hypothetical protein [Aquimarina sp. 2201CG5-10]
MKKNFKELRVIATQVMSRKELKMINAGRMGDSCSSLCTTDADCGGVNRDCTEYYCSGNSGPTFKQCGPGTATY